jgi:DNA (cytosine-5)-methyltransferase 1
VKPEASSLRYLSVCSGIEAASVAWQPLGWHAVAFAEIEAFPSAVLQHHYPNVPNWRDVTTFKDWPDAIVDVLVGGTPCQSFSVAGLRKGLADPRGNLALTYLAVLDRYRPRWCVWENVPGVLSADGGRALGAFLGGLSELGYGFAYRVLDAQYFGLAQRRARVFVVGHLGDWRRAVAVLFEHESLQGHPPPRREAGQGVTSILEAGARTGRSTPAVAFDARQSDVIQYGDKSGPLDTDGHTIAVALAIRGRDGTPQIEEGGEVANAVLTPNGGRGGIGVGAVRHGMQVRRLTPRECERLMGLPDDYTLILYRGKPAADGPRYKALGNLMAVPVMRWIGQRLALVNTLFSAECAS